MEEIPENLEAKFDIIIVIDWFKLDNYLGTYYSGHTHIPEEAGNDRQFYCIPNVPVNGLDRATVLGSYNDECLPWWQISTLLSIAIEDGYLPHCNYVVRVSW